MLLLLVLIALCFEGIIYLHSFLFLENRWMIDNHMNEFYFPHTLNPNEFHGGWVY